MVYKSIQDIYSFAKLNVFYETCKYFFKISSFSCNFYKKALSLQTNQDERFAFTRLIREWGVSPLLSRSCELHYARKQITTVDWQIAIFVLLNGKVPCGEAKSEDLPLRYTSVPRGLGINGYEMLLKKVNPFKEGILVMQFYGNKADRVLLYKL